MDDEYEYVSSSIFPEGWEDQLILSFLAMSCLCCFELAVFTFSLWNSKAKTYSYSIAGATLCSFCFTLGVTLFFSTPPGGATEWYLLLVSVGYWTYIPAQFLVMYSRLHLLGPSWTVMLVCKVVLMAEWILIATPNFILSVAAARSSRFDHAYSISQRIEPTIYSTVSLLLSAVYMYYAYVVFRSDRDQQVRRFLVRLLCTNLFLMVLDSANIVLEYVGGGIVQTGYAAFFFSFQLKLAVWMLNGIGLLDPGNLDRRSSLRPLRLGKKSVSR